MPTADVVNLRGLEAAASKGAGPIASTLARESAQLAERVRATMHDDSPDHIHRARVAGRRLRADLRTFAPLLESVWVETQQHHVRMVVAPFGPVRDADVQLARLRRHILLLDPDDQVAAVDLVAHLNEARENARAHLIAHLDSPSVEATLSALVGDLSRPAVTHPITNDDVTRLVAPRWQKLRRRVRNLGPQPSDAALHRVRIAAKRCRYATEAVGGPRARDFARAMAQLQDELGEHHDAVVAAVWLRGQAAIVSARTAFVAGELTIIEQRAADDVRARWPLIWKHAARPKLRKWLRTPPAAL